MCEMLYESYADTALTCRLQKSVVWLQGWKEPRPRLYNYKSTKLKYVHNIHIQRSPDLMRLRVATLLPRPLLRN